MLFGKKKELEEMPKKGVRVWTQGLRMSYNTYVKKETAAGRAPIDRSKWLQIYGG